MCIDNLFKDCERIAQDYEKHLIDVVITFTEIEFSHKSKGQSVEYNILIGKTRQHYHDEYKKQHTNKYNS